MHFKLQESNNLILNLYPKDMNRKLNLILNKHKILCIKIYSMDKRYNFAIYIQIVI